jgi:replicative DNA helicase
MRRIDLVADGALSGDTARTGFPSIDRWLGGGVRAGDLVVLGGDVGSGKSALALAMALRMSEQGTKVAYLTGEMSVERVMERALAIEGRVKVDDLRQGKLDDLQRAAVGAAAVRLRDRSPNFEVLAHESAEDFGARIREAAAQVVVVDGLQTLAGKSRSQDEELAAVVRMLKAEAVSQDVCLLVTAHLPEWAMRPDPRPVLEDFGAMGEVKRSADVVMAVYREEMYAPGSGVEGATELLVRKNRNGTTGYVDLYFYKQWLRFEDMLDPDR